MNVHGKQLKMRAVDDGLASGSDQTTDLDFPGRLDSIYSDFSNFAHKTIFVQSKSMAAILLLGALFGILLSTLIKTSNTATYVAHPPVSTVLQQYVSSIRPEAWQELVPVETRFTSPISNLSAPSINEALVFQIFLRKLDSELRTESGPANPQEPFFDYSAKQSRTDGLWELSLTGSAQSDSVVHRLDTAITNASQNTKQLISAVIKERLSSTLETLENDLSLRQSTKNLLSASGSKYSSPELSALTAQLNYLKTIHVENLDFPTHLTIDKKTASGSNLIKWILSALLGLIIASLVLLANILRLYQRQR
ncbi:MAG: hypothetical protein WBC71_10110 [Salaquimonas sp.]